MMNWMDVHPYLGSILIMTICATVYGSIRELSKRFSPYYEEESPVKPFEYAPGEYEHIRDATVKTKMSDDSSRRGQE